MFRPHLAALMVVALLLPLAAAGARPVEAEYAARGDILVEGDAAFDAADGLLNLSAGALAGGGLRIGWSDATGYRFWQSVLQERWTNNQYFEESAREDLSFAEGGLDQIACAQACLVLLFPLQEGRVGARGTMDSALRWEDAVEEVWRPWTRQPASDRVALATQPGQLLLDGVALAGAAPVVEGRVGLLLWNLEARVHTAAGDEDVQSGWRETFATGPSELYAPRRVEDSFIFLALEGARLEAAPGFAFSAALGAPTARVAGALESMGADGWVRYGGQLARLDGSRVRIEGVLDVPLRLDGAAVLGGQPLLGGSEIAQRVQGDAEAVRVDGRAVEPLMPEPHVAAATGGLLLVMLGAVWLAFERGFFATLFSRIGRAQVLENENRRALYERVRLEPGLSIAELSRRLGLSRVVVKHHLRTLVAHQMVTSRREGRGPCFFATEMVPDEDMVKVIHLLRDQTRRNVAQVLAAGPGALTQRDLMERTGLSQRLISYHLGRMEELGLVTGEGHMPRRYTPTGRLSTGLAESTPGPAAS